VGNALILEFYQDIPERRFEDNPLEWRIRYQAACESYRKQVGGRYNEGTLLRLLVTTEDVPTRKACLLALGLLGTMKGSNRAISDWLHAEDPDLRQLAAESLWQLWFRGAGEQAHLELQKAIRKRDRARALAALGTILEKYPSFAEAYNQRAIVYFRNQEWAQAAADCQRAIALNPQHFGALSGLGQCLVELRKTRAALRAFRQALKIHPGLEDVEETVRALENRLGDDKK
jgi:tetratricopeptide (TPR) repeat protein